MELYVEGGNLRRIARQLKVVQEAPRTSHLIDWLKMYWIYVAIYIFFLYVSSTSVKVGDDWSVSTWYQDGFLGTLAEAMRMTVYFNGRVATNLFVSFFAYYDFLWRFTAPAIFTSIIYLSARLFGFARRPAPVGVGFLILLSVSDRIRIETYIALITNVQYIPVILLILLYLNIIYYENTDLRLSFWHHETPNYMVVALLAFSIGLWTENLTIAFTVANFLLAILSYLKSRKVSPSIRYGVVGSILSCFVMYGVPARIITTENAALGLHQQVLQNIPGILKMLVVDNLQIYLLFLMVFISSALAGEISSRSTITRAISIIFSSAIAIIILVRIVLQFLIKKWLLPGDSLYFIDTTFFDTNKQIPILFCFAILLFVMVSIFLSRQKEKMFVLYSIGMVSAAAMTAAPYLAARTFTLSIFLLMPIIAYMASTIEIKSLDLRKAVLSGLFLLIFLQADRFFYYGEYAKQIETIRMQLIASYRARVLTGITTDDEWLVLPAYKTDAVFQTGNPQPNYFEMPSFKRYYHLPPNAKVLTDDGFAVKSFSVMKITGAFYRFEVTPLYNVSEYTYTFYVRQNYIVIYKSVEKTDNYDYYEFPSTGTYTVTCMLSHKTNGQKEVSAFEPVEIKTK